MQSLDMVLSPMPQSISSKNGGRNSPKLLDKYKFIRYNDYNERNRRNKEMKKLCRIKYNEQSDEFRLESSHDGKEWGLVVAVKCLKRDGATPDEEPAYIHYSIIAELNNMVSNFGYKYIV